MRVRFAEFTFDSRSGQLRRGDQVVPLTGKASEVLRVLLEHPMEVVTKEDLLERVWRGTSVEEASISVAISTLRAALADDRQLPRFIRTHHRVGYSFCADVIELGADVRDSHARVRSRFWLDWNGRRLVLYEGDNLVGRSAECAVWIEEPKVSRRHARIVVSGDTATLEDLASTNYTYLRGVRIRSPQPLTNRDVIRFGVSDVTFRVSAVVTERVEQPQPRNGAEREPS